jgi:hypothetical protein
MQWRSRWAVGSERMRNGYEWMCCRGFAAKSRLHVAEQAPEFWCRPGALPGHFQAGRDLDGAGLDGTGRDAKQQEVSFVCFANI